MELTVQNVYGLLLRSKLLPIEEARSMFARWQEEARDQSTNLARFAAWMVTHNYLTEYQASLLARGHADGFYLNDYKILERLGKGRMAGVYRSQHKLGQIVAIKVLPPSKAQESTLLARFKREAKLAVRLRHPNIVRSFQMGKAGNLYFLVMEYLDGETLEDVLERRKQLPPAEAVRLVYQALQGLQHIHEQGLVHRDLKPSNLMLVPPPRNETSACTVKILDIGLGRGLVEEGPEPDSGLTGEGVILGTPDYMAPEQARDPRATDIRADIYSLGCVLYHLLAGQPPFPDTNIISQMIKHATEPAPPLETFNPSIPDGLQQIVNWMLAKDLAGRYPTPARAAQALEVFLAAGTGPLSSPDLDPAMEPFLHWLEAENIEGAASPVPAPPSALAPAPPPAPGKPSSPSIPVSSPGSRKPPPPTVPVSPVLLPEKPKTSSGDEKRRSKKKGGPSPVASAAAPPAEALTFDVELVPVLQAGKRKQPAGLTRRDFLMFFAGVVSVIIAYLLGRGLAALFGRSKESNQTPDTPSP
jgi:serine/threonine protein kinase